MDMSTKSQRREVFIVDDDPDVRNRISEMLTQASFEVTGFADGASFVAAAQKRTPACVILDIYMPDRSGLDILRDIDARNYPAPIFIASGRGDIPDAVEAIKCGAFDLVDKRADASTLVERVCSAVESWKLGRTGATDMGQLRFSFPGSELLTPRERDVLAEIASSATSKEAARSLGISWRTVEIHRGHIMRKLGAKNSIDLARKVLGSGPFPPPNRRQPKPQVSSSDGEGPHARDASDGH
jgi:two-component system response regulator FixJ